jgi:AraC-like DNA-binding protein
VSTTLYSDNDRDDGTPGADGAAPRIDGAADAEDARAAGAAGAATAADPAPIALTGDALIGPVEAAGQSLHDAARLSERSYGRARFRVVPTEGVFSYRFVSSGDANVLLRLTRIAGSLVGDVAELDDYLAIWCRDGFSTVTTRGRALRSAPGQPVVLPSAEPFSIEIPPGRHGQVRIARPFLERVATERHGGDIQPITFRHDVRPTPGSIVAWREAIAEMTSVITGSETPPLVRMEADLVIARSFLTTFTWHTERLPRSLLAPRLARVRAAVEFLHENAHLPITPADAALSVGLHTRSMQNSFQRHLGVSPTEYLRRVRLDRVRRDLLEHTPDTATVGELARAWGFGNLGRFAAAYRARFGERPNETLRQRER